MRSILSATAAIALLAGSAMAQPADRAPETEAPAPGATGAAESPALSDGGADERSAPLALSLPAMEEGSAAIENFIEAQTEGQLLAGDLIGQELYDAHGDMIGMVDDVLFGDDQSLEAIIVDVSEFTGEAARRIAIPFGSLAHEALEDDVRLVVNVEHDALEEAPAFTSLAEEAHLHDFQSITEEGEIMPEDGAEGGVGDAIAPDAGAADAGPDDGADREAKPLGDAAPGESGESAPGAK